jgi:hypothetical protein
MGCCPSRWCAYPIIPRPACVVNGKIPDMLDTSFPANALRHTSPVSLNELAEGFARRTRTQAFFWPQDLLGLALPAVLLPKRVRFVQKLVCNVGGLTPAADLPNPPTGSNPVQKYEPPGSKS